MKLKTIIDRTGYNKNSIHKVLIPDDTVLISASFGIFGWSANIRKKDGVCVRFHNGKPIEVLRWGQRLWYHLHHFGGNGRLKQRIDFKAQKAYQEHVINAKVEEI